MIGEVVWTRGQRRTFRERLTWLRDAVAGYGVHVRKYTSLR